MLTRIIDRKSPCAYSCLSNNNLSKAPYNSLHYTEGSANVPLGKEIRKTLDMFLQRKSNFMLIYEFKDG